MRAQTILRQVNPTLWSPPARPWIMRQTWQNLLFAHWPVPVATIAPRLPAGMTLDTYDDQAWIGVVPFRMSQVRPRAIIAVPWLSFFPEINVRTYVTVDNKPGVFFLSLDAGNPLAVSLARRFFRLPYFNAHFAITVTGDTVSYTNRRTHPGAPPAEFSATYRPTGAVYRAAPGSLDYWLTERYCLYTTNPQGQILRAEIRHMPWPLQPAEATITRQTMAASWDITLPDNAPILQYAQHLEVVVWSLERAGD